MGKREFIACFSILFQRRMATAWHPKGLRIARVVSDLIPAEFNLCGPSLVKDYAVSLRRAVTAHFEPIKLSPFKRSPKVL